MHFSLVSKMNEFVVSHDFLEAVHEEEKGDVDDKDDDKDDDDDNEKDPLFEDGLMKKDKGAFFKTDDERQLMLNVLLHSADISNAVKPFPTSKRRVGYWKNLSKATREGAGLPVSPDGSRDNDCFCISDKFYRVCGGAHTAHSKMFPETHYVC